MQQPIIKTLWAASIGAYIFGSASIIKDWLKKKDDNVQRSR